MSEIEFICPYCDERQYLEIEGMTENDEYKEICFACKKEFSYRVVYSVDGFTDKLGEMQWKLKNITQEEKP